MTERELKVYTKLYELTQNLSNEFRDVGGSKRFNDVVLLGFELEMRVINPLKKNLEIREDKLDGINYKLNQVIDTLEKYQYDYIDNKKLTKDEFKNYLIGADDTAMKNIREEVKKYNQEQELNNQTKNEIKNSNIRKNR